jgi:hypothetical protein
MTGYARLPMAELQDYSQTRHPSPVTRHPSPATRHPSLVTRHPNRPFCGQSYNTPKHFSINTLMIYKYSFTFTCG